MTQTRLEPAPRARHLAGMLKGLECTAKLPRFEVATFEGRFRVQKAIFLLKRLGEPGAAPYEYGQYVRGPYSRDLAHDYYALGSKGISTANPAPLENPEAGIVVAAADAKGAPFLEALTTALNLLGAPVQVDATLTWAKALKPHIREPTWTEVRAFLQTHPALTSST
jgi:hypothetical protein